RVGPDVWTRLRLIARRAFGDCYATVTIENGEERSSLVHAPLDIRENLYVIEVFPSGEGATHVDDVALIERL
ncbi:MAG: hypothetical protein J7M38_03155, partial [Armatimonadetes bacterium]|nr:hypothetical protein [Armatimonadota bacterium]